MKLDGYYIERETLMNTLAELKHTYFEREHDATLAHEEAVRCESMFGPLASGTVDAMERAERLERRALRGYNRYSQAINLMVSLGVFEDWDDCLEKLEQYVNGQ